MKALLPKRSAVSTLSWRVNKKTPVETDRRHTEPALLLTSKAFFSARCCLQGLGQIGNQIVL